MNIKSLISRFAPSGKGFIAGGITAAVIYVANHVFHVHLLPGSVESAISPVASFLVASIVHEETKVDPTVEKDVTKVEAEATKIDKDVDPTGLLTPLLGEIRTHLLSDPELKDELVKVAIARLGQAQVTKVEDVVHEIEADEPKVTVDAGPAVAPVFVKTTEPIAHVEVPAPVASDPAPPATPWVPPTASEYAQAMVSRTPGTPA